VERDIPSQQPLSRRMFLDRSLSSLALLTAASAGLPALSASSAAGAPAKSEKMAQAPASLKDVTLRYWDFIDPKIPGPRTEALRQIQENFSKKTGVRLNVEIMPDPLIEPNMIQAAAAGRTPDIVRITVRALSLHVGAKTIMPLNDLAAKLPKDDWLVSWNTHVYDGRKMGIPIENRCERLWYRKDYLENAGIKVPASLDELGRAGKTLTRGRVLGFIWGLSKANRSASFETAFVPLLWDAGGDLLDKNGKAAFNSEAGVRVFQWMRDMVYKYQGLPKEAVAYHYNNTVDGVKSGAIAMAFAGTHRIVATRNAGGLGGNLQSAPVPGFEPGKPSPANIAGWVYAIGKDSKQPEAAWAYIEHAVNQESQVINARVGGELPSRKSTYSDPWFKTAEAAELLSWKDYMDKGGRSMQYPEKYLEGMEYLADQAAEVILNNKPIKQALDDAAKKYNTIA